MKKDFKDLNIDTPEHISTLDSVQDMMFYLER